MSEPVLTQSVFQRKNVQILVCLALLIVLYAEMMLWHPLGGKQANGVIFGLHVIPVVMCALFAFKNQYRGFIWINYISMMLFCVAAANLFSGYGWPIYLEVALTSALFLLSLLAAMSYRKKKPKSAA
ncbi:MAG: hypothetical protein AAGF06_05860 [Pseudomonadota bacterium]